MVVYIASRSPLPLIPWREEAPAFHVTELAGEGLAVLRHFTLPNARYAGSHTYCGCGFNENDEYQEEMDPADFRADALKSLRELSRCVREHGVGQIYSCWSGDEGEEMRSERSISPEDLAAADFTFRERERINIVQASEKECGQGSQVP